MELHCVVLSPLSYYSLTLSLISDALEQQADSPDGVINGSWATFTWHATVPVLRDIDSDSVEIDAPF